MAFIEIRDLHRVYRTIDGPRVTEQAVFQGLDLDIEKGQMVAIIGPSGCGKSTLLNLIGGLDAVSARETVRLDSGNGDGRREVATLEGGGEIRIGEFSMSSRDGDAKSDFMNRNIGFVFQLHHLIPELTALDNVALPRQIRGESLSDARRAAAEMLGRVGMASHGDKRPPVLSGGERQRIAIARALINRPQVVLADEPTGSLDPKRKGAIFDLLQQINREEEITVILVTHDRSLLRDADGVSRAHRVIALDESRRRTLESERRNEKETR